MLVRVRKSARCMGYCRSVKTARAGSSPAPRTSNQQQKKPQPVFRLPAIYTMRLVGTARVAV